VKTRTFFILDEGRIWKCYSLVQEQKLFFFLREGGNIFSVEFPPILSEEIIGVFKIGVGNSDILPKLGSNLPQLED